MQMTAQKYGYAKNVNCSFAEAVERVKNALQEQGFGVQAEINLSGALREKLGVEMPPQIILGACNPQLAYQALRQNPRSAYCCLATSLCGKPARRWRWR